MARKRKRGLLKERAVRSVSCCLRGAAGPPGPATPPRLSSRMRNLQDPWIPRADCGTRAFEDFGIRRRVLEPVPPGHCLYHVLTHLKRLENSMGLYPWLVFKTVTHQTAHWKNVV